jgi:hypothetical protein
MTEALGLTSPVRQAFVTDGGMGHPSLPAMLGSSTELTVN